MDIRPRERCRNYTTDGGRTLVRRWIRRINGTRYEFSRHKNATRVFFQVRDATNPYPVRHVFRVEKG